MRKTLLFIYLSLLNACYSQAVSTVEPQQKLPEIQHFSSKAQAISVCPNTLQPCTSSFQLDTEKLASLHAITLLPDSIPVAFQNHLLVLGQPDSESYRHGVLGDDIEAKTLYTLDAQTLRPSAQAFTLPAHLVFEHNKIEVWNDKIVAVISGQNAGARVAVLELRDQAWHIIAESSPLPNYRWQSPFVLGKQLYSVQMPHLRGRLVQYEIQDRQLIETAISDGLSNHQFGSHETQIAAILPDYALIPDMDYHQIYALHHSGQLYPLSPKLPAAIVRSISVHHTAYLFLEDGSVWAWTPPTVAQP